MKHSTLLPELYETVAIHLEKARLLHVRGGNDAQAFARYAAARFSEYRANEATLSADRARTQLFEINAILAAARDTSLDQQQQSLLATSMRAINKAMSILATSTREITAAQGETR